MSTDRPTLLAKIDWYSFTVPLAGSLAGCGADSLGALNHALQPVLPRAIDPLSSDGTWSIEPAKGFYSFRATHRASMVAVSWGEVNAHAFVELAGRSCDWLRAAGAFTALVAATHLRVSRIDAAIDLRTATTPETFVQCGHAERFADSLGNIKSTTGHTFYVGSRKSDRCARVYRYAPPHPRSNLLRVEAEFKGKAAKELALVLNASGELEAIRAAHKVFSWASPEMTMDFLALASCAPGLQTSPDMVSSAGYLPASYLRLFDTTPKGFWMLESGWKAWYFQRLKPRLTV